MHHAAYLSPSRHGIFYFRWPIPAEMHPAGRRTDIKISLRTRSPAEARMLSRVLISAGQAAILRASGRAMKYEDIRQHVEGHFRNLLAGFRARTAEDGPVDEQALRVLEASVWLAEAPTGDAADITRPDGADGLLREFCELRGVDPELDPKARQLLLSEIQKGYRSYLRAALDHNAALGHYDLSPAASPAPAPATEAHPEAGGTDLLADVAKAHLDEGTRIGKWRAKTLTEKQDALELLVEVVGNKPVASMTKADARDMKAVLQKLPKNRSKNPATRDLSLADMLEAAGVERLSVRTMDAYISHCQTLMGWAEKQGYCTANVFDGFRFGKKANTTSKDRKPFTAEQLQRMFLHLTENPAGAVRKDDHKWPTLIGIFTGARLNEIAQLRVGDIVQDSGVWCFDFNDEDGKALKNDASRRRTPVHDRLLELGLLDFVQARRAEGSERLFPSFTYSKQNGYGRNLGRWFNESFLPAIGIDDAELTFHCLRHTMITRLRQADVALDIVKALVGHKQEGVTHEHYFKEGFTPRQLQREMGKFEF